MKKLFFTLCLLAVISSLTAGPVDQQKAAKLGAKFLRTTVLNEKNSNIQLNCVSVTVDFQRGGIDYYVFNVKGGEGFVIVAGDDRVKPILAYSTTGQFDPNDVAESFQFTLDGYREEIQYIREHNLKATPDITAEWKSLTENGSLNRGGQTRAVVGPLCQTIWHQNYPYNSQCPADTTGSGGYVYAGCVATAMGQVLKFWDWPAQGTGSYSYYPDGYPQQTANFGETEYHFELMPLALDSTSTDEEIHYVAQLLHHLGISVDMIYGGNGSGAFSDDVPNALRNYFRYNCDNHITNHNGSWWGTTFTNEEWIQMLKEGGLDEQLPLYYSGSDDNNQGGHAFVCDGYDENDYFHFNWGWSGKDDAWCPIGALNTTKYAFNRLNGFTGHIIPNNDEYYLRPDSVANMLIVENETFNGIKLSWTNPTTALNGSDLTNINVTIRRNFEVIAELTDTQVGAYMEYEDNNLEPGLYEYAIYVSNEAGISRNTYRKVLVGEKCDITFVLHDDGGDGWKGAAISVADEDFNRLAIVTMTEGSDLALTLPLLKGNLNFIWNHGWYHTQELYDTDYECSFTILDYEGNELFVSDELEDGVFMTYENNCEESPLTCYPVQNLEAEYQWVSSVEFGAYFSWDKPTITTFLQSFYILRNAGDGEFYMIAEIPFSGATNYTYFDNLAEQGANNYTYLVRSNYYRDEDYCGSDSDYQYITVTHLEETTGEDIKVYPNPTSGLLNVNGNGTMHITVSNVLGQRLLETTAKDSTTLDLSRYESGFYLVRIESAHGVTVQKVNLQK